MGMSASTKISDEKIKSLHSSVESIQRGMTTIKEDMDRTDERIFDKLDKLSEQINESNQKLLEKIIETQNNRNERD